MNTDKRLYSEIEDLYYEGLSIREIAKRLNLSVKKVKEYIKNHFGED